MRLLLDIGATNTRIGVSHDGYTVDHTAMFSTPATFTEGIKQITQAANSLSNGKRFTVAVAGIAGPLNQEKTQIVNEGNIPGWFQQPLKAALEAVIHAPTFLENDTALVALGEANFGGGRGQDIVAYLTFSTGIGGARIVNRQIDRNRWGFEPSFQIASYDASRRGFEPNHYIRYYLSGAQLKARYNQDPPDIVDDTVWDEVSRWMAVAVNNAIVFWSPDCIVLGGPLLRRASFKRVIGYVRQAMIVFPELPLMREAELGDYGGLYGALVVANNQQS
jgi:predicted NBD/HSP70 family sugar kinase